MEYLMTYGWALLVIVIVIAVLLYINPFRAPEQCTFDQAGLYCERPVLQVAGISKDPISGVEVTGVNSLLSARIINGERRTITITGIACARGMTRPNADMSTWRADNFKFTEGVDLAPQETLELRAFDDNKGNPLMVRCLTVTTKAGGSLDLDVDFTPENTKLRANEDFSGRVWVMYRFADEPADAPSKLIGANLVTRAQ